MNIEDVIRLYRDSYYAKHKRLPRRPNHRHTADRANASAFLAWCDEHFVDPATIIKLRFDYLWDQKRVCPPFNRLRIVSLVPIARREEAQGHAAATQTEQFTQVVRDLTRLLPTHEQVRRRYFFQQDHALCEQNVTSGGYDPRSHYCPSCPRAKSCAKHLNAKWDFNVVALRAGRLGDVPEAVRKALRGWDGSISV